MHFMGPQNKYEAAINMVGAILEPYDYDKMFPVFGFGGVAPGGQKVNHCFALTGDLMSPMVPGVAGIIGIYRQTLPSIKFSGPTFFRPILDAFYDHCLRQKDKQRYNVLLILTDGTIHDMAQTKAKLVDLSELAASVIIVGLGDADFEAMEELDGDPPNNLTDDSGRVGRDIVQFVEFDKAI